MKPRNAFVRDRWTGVTTRVQRVKDRSGADGSVMATISGNGRAVAIASNDPDLVPRDTNNTDDVFVRDRV